MTTTELLARRDELHAEMIAAPAAKHDSQWMRDRANEMAFLNRQLARLGAIPAPLGASQPNRLEVAPADHSELAAHAEAWRGDRPADDEAPTEGHSQGDEAWWGEFGPTNFDQFDVIA